MDLYLRSRLAIVVLACFIASGAIAVLGSGSRVPFLNFNSGTVSLPIPLVVPIMVTVGVAAGLGRRIQIEAAASRDVKVLDVSLLASALVLNLGFAVVAHNTGSVLTLPAARNTVALVGATLLAFRVLGRAASALPATVWVVLSAMLGVSGTGSQWWAIPIAPASSVSSWVLAIVVFVTGAMYYLRSGRADWAGQEE